MKSLVTVVAGIAVILTALSYVGRAVAEDENSSLDQKQQQLIDDAAKKLSNASKLKSSKCSSCRQSTHGKIIELSPCGSVANGNILVEMATDLCAGDSEPADVLFIQYLFCIDNSNNTFVLKQAGSLLIEPGQGLCGIPTAELNDLQPGAYTIVGRVSTQNTDGSETIRATKSCRFQVP